MRLHLAAEIARAAVFDGWGDEALLQASERSGVDSEVAKLAFPGGAIDMIAAWIAAINARMEAAFNPAVLAQMPVRERIRSLIWFRLECVAGTEEALRRALAIQAMPQNLARSASYGWSSADKMWRLAGDVATDYNHYTKRATLASIYAATLTVFVGDESEDKADTRAFLDRRIEGVMKFEKAKAQMFSEKEHFSMTRFLGRLRYPAR